MDVSSRRNSLTQQVPLPSSNSLLPTEPSRSPQLGGMQASPQRDLADALAPLLPLSPGTDVHELASQRAAEILACVSRDKFDGTLLIGTPGEALLMALPAAGWAALQQHAKAQSDSGITTVILSPLMASAGLDGREPVLVEGLNQLPALQILNLINPYRGWINLRCLCREGREPPTIGIHCDSDCGSAASGPWKVHAPNGATVVADNRAAVVQGSKVVYFEGDTPVKELTLGGYLIPGGLLPQQAQAIETHTNILTSALLTVKTVNINETRAAQVARAIVACVDDTGLDFTRLTGRENLLALADLPVAGWDALNAFILAMSGAGIESVVLPRDLSVALQFRPGNTLIRGLNSLEDMNRLVVKDPVKGELDLSDLNNAACGRAIEIQSTSEDPGPWDVLVRADVNVSANSRAVASKPSTVSYFMDDGSCETKALYGQIYDRKPTDFGMNSQAARDLNLNGKAIAAGSRVLCGPLSGQWLRDRAEHRAAKDAQAGFPGGLPGSGRYAYTKSMSQAAISKNVGSDDEIQAIWQAGPRALFEVRQFGDLLAQEFESLKSGDTRQIIVGSTNHAMAAELRVKDGEYVVSFYDPNRTAMHVRLVVSDPATLRGRSLEDWITPGLMDTYFGAGGNARIGDIYYWPAGIAQRSTTEALQHHVAAQHRESPQFLFYLLGLGRNQEAAAVMAANDEFLATALARHASGEIDGAQLQAQVVDRFGGMAGWWHASSAATVPAFEKFLNWVLRSPLSSLQKYELLRAGGNDNSGLAVAIMQGTVDFVGTYSRLVANASDAELSPEHRQALLGMRDPAASAHGVPLLHHLASRGIDDLVPLSVKAISEFVGGILQSSLSLEAKAALCGAAYESTPDAKSAVQKALAAGHPTVASAIAFAIPKREPDVQRRDLLAMLKVDMGEIGRALRRRVETSAGSSDSQET